MKQPERRSKLLNPWIISVGTFCIAVLALFVVFELNNRPPNIPIPTPKMPKVNAWDDFERAKSLNGGGKQHWGPLSDPNPKHIWSLAEYESFMKDNAAALAALKDGLTKPYLHPPVRGFDIPIYAEQRELARTTGSAGMYYQLIGNPGKAVDAYLDGMEFGVMLPKGGCLISGLSGMAIETICAHRLNILLVKLGPSDLARVADRLNRIDQKRVPYSDVLMDECWLMTSIHLQVFRDIRGPKSVVGNCVTFTNTKRVWPNVRFAFLNKTAMFKENIAYYEAVAQECIGPYTGKSSIAPPNNPLSGAIPIDARVCFATNEARFALMQTEVALIRYRLVNGRCPGRLSDLKPVYLKSESIDPFGGKLLCYHRLNGGKDFLLYSIGPNLNDDKGAVGFQSDDIVAGKCY